MNSIKKVLLVGGGGYVGTELQKMLAESNYQVRVLDTFWYPSGIWNKSDGNFVSKIEYIEGDIRNRAIVIEALKGMDACIHLACISNDPSFELNPDLGKSINLDSFEPLVKISKELGVKRFIYASSSSVYGIKDEKDVHENMTLEPLTDYSKFKVQCEVILQKFKDENFTVVTIRPALLS